MKILLSLTIALFVHNTVYSKTIDNSFSVAKRVGIMKQAIHEFDTQREQNPQLGSGRYYIGADASCDFSTIQAGINATVGDMNAPELLIASNKVYTENLVLQNIHMFMDGSYSSCSNARNGIHGGDGARITGFSGSPIILVLGGSFAYQIVLRRILLQNRDLCITLGRWKKG